MDTFGRTIPGRSGMRIAPRTVTLFHTYLQNGSTTSVRSSYSSSAAHDAAGFAAPGRMPAHNNRRMALTDHQAAYLAHLLTLRRAAGGVDRLAATFVDAQVTPHAHQVDAALFAFRSPLSKGALLADEVGLGKTIEAGLVLAQRWAERKRRLLVITPANLRKQWMGELTEKFFLPCRILESKSWNEAVRKNITRPFERGDAEAIVICSYEFARAKAEDLAVTSWDLVVLDEAHRLRNVYKPGNVIANTLKTALAGRHKLLLTATPMQNSLLELYGLVSFIDEHAFGDVRSFREQYTGAEGAGAYETLKARLKPVCHRTLRRQVREYIRFTHRHALLERFTPDDDEQQLYDLVSDYLMRPSLQALPSSQRTLTTLVLRKLLASSTFAIAGALEALASRLRGKLSDDERVRNRAAVEMEAAGDAFAFAGGTNDLAIDYEPFADTAEEWHDDEPADAPLADANRAVIAEEAAELERYAALAKSIEENSKGRKLLATLDAAFAKAEQLGAKRKAIIFTESRRTQDYLMRRLAASPYAEGIVLFNGSNTDAHSKEIFARWKERHAGSDKITGSNTADMRSALVDYFRDEGRIMIATEAGAEGINLQFCSLVVNYDLPWNPQRIEQRIGRCHRYGQQHDVVVVNFLNVNNAADARVFELLAEKFQLFEGVFGASDEVLGAIESGVDFEKRIAKIYQDCRRPQEIQAAFDELQRELSAQIGEAMDRTRRSVIEEFDDEVREKLQMYDKDSKVWLDRFERTLMRLTRHELGDAAEWADDSSFRLVRQPIPGLEFPLGLYELPRRTGDAHFYRLGHPLAARLIEHAGHRVLPSATLAFSYDEHEGKVTVLEPWIGHSGWLAVSRLKVHALQQDEEHLIVAAATDEGVALDEETARRLLTLPARVTGEASAPPPALLEEMATLRRSDIEKEIARRNMRHFEAESDKLDNWADDRKVGLEREIREIDRQIREARRAAAAALTLEEKLAGQKAIKALEATRTAKRRSFFEAQDEIDRQRAELIERIEAMLGQDATANGVFTIRWSLT